jgi:hypothetical protein
VQSTLKREPEDDDLPILLNSPPPTVGAGYASDHSSTATLAIPNEPSIGEQRAVIALLLSVVKNGPTDVVILT